MCGHLKRQPNEKQLNIPAIKIRPSESLSSHTVVCFDDHFPITLRSPPRTITIINTNGAPIAQEYVNVLPGILMKEETSHPVGAAIFKNQYIRHLLLLKSAMSTGRCNVLLYARFNYANYANQSPLTIPIRPCING